MTGWRVISIATLAALLPAGGTAGAASWTVDPAKSALGFTGTASGQSFSGTFKHFTATIEFDPAKPEGGHALVTIDTGSASTGDTQKDELMPGSDFFNVAAFPRATFEARSFRALGGDGYEAEGTLTIRDKSLPVSLPFRFTQQGGIAHVTGALDIKRQAYDVGQNAWAADDNVASAVKVTIDLVAGAK